MKKRIYQTIKISGFSLVEMAVVIFIAGILLSAGLKLLSAKVNSAQIETTKTHQEAIKQALISYLGKNKRLPCPADVANGASTVINPPCASVGILPYAELGLDQATALDGWENYFTFAVTPNPITSPLPFKNPAYSTAWLYAYSPITVNPRFKNDPLLTFWASNSTGGITISDGANVIANPSLGTGAVVAVISHGRNGYGAFNVKKIRNDSTNAGADEQQNIDPETAIGNISLIKRDVSDSSADGGVFDDLVFTANASELISPLITNGTISENIASQLNRANDFIIGNIISTKTCIVPCSETMPTYKYLIPNLSSIPAGTFEPGVDYQNLITEITATTPLGNDAYILKAGDGTMKVITVNQLRGLLARASGFN